MSAPLAASSSSAAFDQLPMRPGQTLKHGRYEIHRKLGSGVYSTTWLVSDNQAEYDPFCTNKYLAAKILSHDGMHEHRTGRSRELEFLQQIAACEDINALPVLTDHFEEPGLEGSHLCLVMHLMGSDVSSFRRSSPTKSLPVYTVKNVLAYMLEGLVQLHELDIIHTDLKLSNILFDSVRGDREVDEKLKSEPAAVEGEVEINGEPHPIFQSQPIRPDFKWDASPFIAEAMQLVVIDLGQGDLSLPHPCTFERWRSSGLTAQRAGEQPTVDEFSAYALRAPELLLRSDFGPKVDIWALGCITFELLTGRWLFPPEAGEDWSLEEDHLAKMMELTGERFSSAMLERAQFRSKYLDEHGNLLRLELLPGQSIEAALTAYKTVPESEVAGAADFIRQCLRLDSSQRPSAKELELHPWLRTSSCAHYTNGVLKRKEA